MEEELQGGICGGNLWNSSRNLFASSPCSSVVNGGVGSFGWSNGGVVVDMMKTATDSGGSVQDVQKPHHLGDLNQDLLHESGRSQENYSYIFQALNSSMNCRKENFYSDSSMNSNQSFPTEPNSFTNFPLINYNLFDADSQSLLDYHQMMNSSQFLPSLANYKVYPSKQQPGNNFQFINNTPFWNATTAAPVADVPASFRSQLVPSSLRKANAKHSNEKAGNESAKRPRTETPSPSPAFKVRKEKLGDRVTALQQLVSPFGKTDTASVLHEAIEYIKLLHDQVTVLSTPYLKNGLPPLQCQKDQEEEARKELRSRGLCLVPISSTFPVAAETSPDFWTPTFGGSFR